MALIRDIKKLIMEHDSVLTKHIFEEANLCIDALANMGCIIDDLCVFSKASGDIFGLVKANKLSALASLEAAG